MSLFTSLLAARGCRRLRARYVVARTKAIDVRLVSEPDAAVRERSLDLRFRAKSGESPEALMAEAFALAGEAIRRVLALKPFDVQILAGAHLASKCIVEMAT